MASRIIAFGPTGVALYAIDGHHGSAHGARWAAAVSQQLAGSGIDPIIVEIEPQQGGDAVRREVIGSVHRVRLELRTRPDGLREVLGLLRISDADDPRAAVAATPEPIGCGWRVIQAPADVAAPRQPVRVSRGRHADVIVDPAQARIERQRAKATQREVTA